jgi:hypothetical protein
MMKLQCVVILISSLLVSGCAFIDGLKNSQDQIVDDSNKQNEAVAAPVVLPAKDNPPAIQAAKTIAPLTR